MALNHIQKGNHMTWTNNTGADVESGSAVPVGARIGVALVDIPNGETGELAMGEVWELPNAGVEILQGATVYLDGNKEITTVAENNLQAGFAFAAAASDESVRVKINA
ncbi:DUF2190 family protein [Maridesulfovibrio sp.]|uniref:DUF2190 family protein n=1 Tax=Maridesulfovibrio sp. TaxID=2795000 RepID=UPI003BAB6954